MTWVITAVVATGAIQAIGARKAAKTQKIELERQAEQEKLSAEGRELQRREQLNKVLAANAVSLASSGIAGEGSPESIALSSAKKASVSEGLESLSDRLKQAQLRRQAKNVAASGNIQAASTLLNTGIRAASLKGGD